jgi:hypothetical protein
MQRRRWQRTRSIDFPILTEQAKHKCRRARGGGRQQSAPTLCPQPMAYTLKHRPLESTRLGNRETNPRKAPGVGKVRDAIEVDLPSPEITRQGSHRRNTRLRKEAIPLCPHGGFAVAEVERIDDRASLPAVIRRILRQIEHIATARDVTPPKTRDVYCVNIHSCAQETAVPSSAAITRDTLR